MQLMYLSRLREFFDASVEIDRAGREEMVTTIKASSVEETYDANEEALLDSGRDILNAYANIASKKNVSLAA